MPGRSFRPGYTIRKGPASLGACGFVCDYAGTRRRILACPGVVLDQLHASMGGPASLSATPWQASFSPDGRERSLVPEVGVEPTRDYSQGILSPITILLSMIYVNSPQHSTTRQATQRRGLTPHSLDGDCWRLLGDVGGKCPMSVPLTALKERGFQPISSFASARFALVIEAVHTDRVRRSELGGAS